MDNLDIKLLIPFIVDILDRTRENGRIGSYYERLRFEHLSKREYQDFREKSLFPEQIAKGHFVYTRAADVASCGKSHIYETYALQHVKDLKSIKFCHDKMCPVCQKQKALSRVLKFAPVLNAVAQEYDLYNITLTIPNCSADELDTMCDKMFKVFPYLVRYFLGRAKIKGLDFLQYGCTGAFRALEITYKYNRRSVGQEYHPHLHGMLALRKGLILDKTETNKFSKSFKSDKPTLFSNLEITIQKIWYLLMNDQIVNLKNISAIPLGYSCTIDPIENQNDDATSTNSGYYEVFKYCCKSFGENNESLRFDQFKPLVLTLHRRRCIQGYGCFYNIHDDDAIDKSFIAIRDIIKRYLCELEMPHDSVDHINAVLEDLCADVPEYTYLNMKSIYHLDTAIRERLLSAPDNREQIRLTIESLKHLTHMSVTPKTKSIGEMVQVAFDEVLERTQTKGARK
jgi:plasmid rolling circle replication initiator protein Rep